MYITVSLGNMKHYLDIPDKLIQVHNLNLCSSIPKKVLRMLFVSDFKITCDTKVP